MLRRNRNDNLGVLLLLQHLIFTIGIENIPPVTLGTVGLQVSIFTGFLKVPWRSLQECCISSYTLFEHRDYMRLLSSVLVHADSMHLYYNMASFVWKGMVLEAVLGKPFFAFMLIVFSVLTGLVSTAINYLLAVAVDPDFFFSCAVGFSGVIFALKVVINSDYPEVHPTVAGFEMRIPGGLYVWLELALMSLIAPGSSFVGHLAGILVGVMYTKGWLHPIFDLFGALVNYHPHRYESARASRGARTNTDARGYRYGDPSFPGAFFGGSRYTHSDYVYNRRNVPLFNFEVFRSTMPFFTVLIVIVLTGVFYKDFLPTSMKFLYGYIEGKCLNAYLIYETRRYSVMVSSALHTLNKWHLLYCILTLLKVASPVERRLGGIKFIALLIVLTLSVGYVYVALVHNVLSRYFEESIGGIYPFDMNYKCFIGPSAVLIALKCVHASFFPRTNTTITVIELPSVPLGIGFVIEIILLHLLFPQAWIVANVAGLLAGMVFALIFK